MSWWAVTLIAAGSAAAVLLPLLALWLRLPKIMAQKLRGGFDNADAALRPDPAAERAREKVTVIRDLPYPSEPSGYAFDLYLPQTQSPRPLIVWIHGGGFVAGTKAGTESLMLKLCAEGYAVLSTDYAVAPEYKYPTAIRQINRLAGYLDEVAAAYPQIDPGKIVMGGDSAGGQLAAQYTAIETNERLAAEMKLERRLKDRVKGLILVSAPTDVANMLPKKGRLKLLSAVFMSGYFGLSPRKRKRGAKQARVTAHVTEKFPPAFLTDGNTVSFEGQNRALGEALRAKGVPVEELYFDKETYGTVNHEYIFEPGTPAAAEGFEKTAAFLKRLF